MSYKGVFSQATSDSGGYMPGDTVTPPPNSGYNPGDLLRCIVQPNTSGINVYHGAPNAFIGSPPASGYTQYWEIIPAPVTCFLDSAPVLTPSGYRYISTLKAGDLIQTDTGIAVPIKAVKITEVFANRSVNPYTIPKGHLGATKKLAISPNHKVQVGDKMIEARSLNLEQIQMTGTFKYYNLELPNYEKMIVAGVTVESLYPITRVKMTMDEFSRAMTIKYGKATPQILECVRRTVRRLPDGRVEVPCMRN